MRAVLMVPLVLALGLATPPVARGEEPVSLDALLEQVREGRARDGRENAERLARFRAEREKQAERLEALRAEHARLTELSEAREAEFQENETAITELDQRLKERMGSLTELFGVLQQAATDAQARFQDSLTHPRFPERPDWAGGFAARMGQASRLPDMAEVERLWFELHRELTESGRVVRHRAPVVGGDGVEREAMVTRVGLFNLVSDGRYLQFVPETGRVVEYPRQPSPRHLQGARALEAGAEAPVPFAVDPTRGQLLALKTQTPDLRERVEQGGVIGYIILALGGLALLVALERWLSLTLVSARMRGQLRRLEEPGRNPLGRVLAVFQEHRDADTETLELKLGEAVLKETPRLNRRTMLLKMIAVVAPLLGLLGTVTGMILTFQAITLYGTGDPRLMAGGISQALVTTVLGLAVAIPTLLIHSLVQGRARGLAEVLEQQAVGIVARQAEARSG